MFENVGCRILKGGFEVSLEVAEYAAMAVAVALDLTLMAVVLDVLNEELV